MFGVAAWAMALHANIMAAMVPRMAARVRFEGMGFILLLLCE
jgi:hypothetical protein